MRALAAEAAGSADATRIAILPGCYDAFIYLDETRAVTPLHMPVRVDGELPETYPSGV